MKTAHLVIPAEILLLLAASFCATSTIKGFPFMSRSLQPRSRLASAWSSCRKNVILASESSSSSESKEATDDNEKSCSSVVANNSDGNSNSMRGTGYRFGAITRGILDRAKESSKQTSEKQGGGYRFGDISRGLMDKATDITGQDSPYKFGDVTRWVDQMAKEKVANITGKEKYEFGDLTRAFVSNYTGKANNTVGDLSQEVVRRVQSGEYTVEDVWLALRILLTAGFGFFAPVAGLLPIRLLLNLVNLGLAQEVSGRMLGALAETLDKRMKEVVTGSSSYALGDLTKDRLQSQLSKFTGKDRYEFGDLSRTISKLATQTDRSSSNSKKKVDLQESILDNLDFWDKQNAAAKGK